MSSPSSRQTKRSDDKPVALMTHKEMLAHIEQWWKDRVDSLNSIGGMYGRDLRNQEDLLKTVMGLEQDVTQLLRYVRDMLVKLEATEEGSPTDSHTNTKAKSKPAP